MSDKIMPWAVLQKPKEDSENLEYIKSIIIIGISLIVGYCIHAGIGLVP
jgi:hypothetical protein